MSIPWETQQKNDIKWYAADINKNISLHTSCDYFTLIYKDYCKYLHGKSFQKALDVGISNTGGYMSFMPGISKRFGLDPAVDYLRSIDMLPVSSHIKYVRGFAEEMPFGDKSFDLVVVTNAIDHVRDMEKSIEEIRRVLKDDGLVLFATYLRVTKPHPWTFQDTLEAQKLFKGFKVLEHHEVKDNRPFYSRNNAYIAIMCKGDGELVAPEVENLL
jgi:ubiquinone/menaquinone biosynthesis C-methylase UbiE